MPNDAKPFGWVEGMTPGEWTGGTEMRADDHWEYADCWANGIVVFDAARHVDLRAVLNMSRLARFLASATADEWLARRIDPEAFEPRPYTPNQKRTQKKALARAREIRLGLSRISSGEER
jgi:hypothetical protein